MKISFNNFTPAFRGKYVVDSNQTLPNIYDYGKRDLLFALWSSRANNRKALAKDLQSSYTLLLNKEKAPVMVMFDFPDQFDKYFEKDMKKMGQKFDKIS